MKAIKYLSFLILLFTSGLTVAQEKSPEEVKNMITSQNFVFMADRALPMSGSNRMLTPGYELTISPDTIIAYLPYFGRAYAAITSGDGGIKFTSTNFDYKATERGKKWQVRIKFEDASGVQDMNLDIYQNGTANLRVSNTNRQSISYTGYIKEGKPVDKKAF